MAAALVYQRKTVDLTTKTSKHFLQNRCHRVHFCKNEKAFTSNAVKVR